MQLPENAWQWGISLLWTLGLILGGSVLVVLIANFFSVLFPLAVLALVTWIVHTVRTGVDI